LEITSINQEYLINKTLLVEKLGRGFAWLDTGTHESLLEASNYINSVEHRQGLKIACLEEIAYNMGYISKKQLLDQATLILNNEYGKYLMRFIKEK